MECIIIIIIITDVSGQTRHTSVLLVTNTGIYPKDTEPTTETVLVHGMLLCRSCPGDKIDFGYYWRYVNITPLVPPLKMRAVPVVEGRSLPLSCCAQGPTSKPCSGFVEIA